MNLGKSNSFELIENNSIFQLKDFLVRDLNATPDSTTQTSAFVNGTSVRQILSELFAAQKYGHSIYLSRESSNFPSEKSDISDNSLGRSNISHQVNQNIIWLQSSGTTGRPKWIPHQLDRLCDAISTGTKRAIWMLCFEPTSFAGLQVILSALLGGHKLVCPIANATPSQLVQLTVNNNITHMSATPTFWRSFLRASGSLPIALKQITLGGEVADQSIIDALRLRFTFASIRHIYATTELGVVMTIQDGKAGFPASWLGKTLANGIRLSISNDQTLLVSNPKISFNDSVDYCDTRDVVAITDDRVFFKGRADTLINVGGLKVFPEEVEAHLLKLPQISDVLVSSQPNPITGQILIAEIVPNGLIESELLRNQIEDHLRELPRHARPALLRFKAQLSNVRTGKKSRLQ